MQPSNVSDGKLLSFLNSSWLAFDLSHLVEFYQFVHDTRIPYVPFHTTLWSIFFWALCILVVAPRALGVVFSIVIFFVARIPGVRLTVGKISIIDGFQDIKFHYDESEINVSISVDAIKLRPWFYAPALVQKPRKFLVGLIERPEIILCIKAAEQDERMSAQKHQENASPIYTTKDSKLLKFFASLLEILVSKLSIKVTRDRKNELLAIDCLKTSILGNYYAHLEAPVQSPRRFLGIRNFRHYMKASSLFCPEIVSQNFCCQIQHAELLESNRKPSPAFKYTESKNPPIVSGGLPPPAPPPPPINSLLNMLTFSPWKPPLGVNFEFNSGHAKQDVYSMASELNRRNIPAAFSISSFSLLSRVHGNVDEKSSLKWDLNVSPICFVCSLDHLQKLSSFTNSSSQKALAASQQSMPTSNRLLLEKFEKISPIFPLSCTFEKIVLCAAFSVSDGPFPASNSNAPSTVGLDALQISFENTRFTCEAALLPIDHKSDLLAVQGHASVAMAFESLQGSYMSVHDTSFLDLNKFECNIKLSLGQASISAGQRSLAAEAKIARARAAGVNGLVQRRARRPSADAGHIAFIMSEASGADESVTLDIQSACAELALMVTNSLLQASAHLCLSILSLADPPCTKSTASIETAPQVPSLLSRLSFKCQIETVCVVLGDFSREKDAMTEIAWKKWTIRFSEEPGTFSNRSVVTETSTISVKFSIGRAPATISHRLHGMYLQNSHALISMQGFKVASSSSNGHSIDLKSIIILLSEPVVFDFALAMTAISANLHVHMSALSKSAHVLDARHSNSHKTPASLRLDVKNIDITLFHDCSTYATRISDTQVGSSSEKVWLSLFHFACSDMYYERSYKTGKSALHHLFSIGMISLFYMSPPNDATQDLKHVSAEDFFRKDTKVLQVLDFNRIKVRIKEEMASSLIVASIRAVGAHEGRECVSLNMECVTAFLSAGSVFNQLTECCQYNHSNQHASPVRSSDTQNVQPAPLPEIWMAVDCESMSFTFSATPRSKLQASFAVLSVRQKSCHEALTSTHTELVGLDDGDNVILAGPHGQFFESVFEQKNVKDGSPELFAFVVSKFRLNYLSCVALERVPFSSFRLGPDVNPCENLLTIATVALTMPSNPASEHNEEKLRAMLQQRVICTEGEEELLHCPPSDHVTLQLVNVSISSFISPTTTVSGRNVLKNKPGGLVDFGMIMDDTLLAIKAFQKAIDDGAVNNSVSKKDSEKKLALCLFVKQVKLCVKEHRLVISKDGEALFSGEGWLWALHCLQQDESVEREKRWVEVQKIMKLQKAKQYSGDEKVLRHAFDSENATIWKERVKKLKEKLRHQLDIIPDLCVISIDHIIVGLTSWSPSLLINSMLERLDDSGAKRSVFQSEWPEFDEVHGGTIFGSVSKFRMQLRAFEKPLIKFETYEWIGKVIMAEERSHHDILIPCFISLKQGTQFVICIRRSCLPMKLYHSTQATMSGFCFFYGAAHAQCISMMGAALSSLSPPSPVAIAPLLPFDKLRLMLHGTSDIQFIPSVADGPAIEALLSISPSPQAFGDAVQFSFNGVKLETSLARLALECRGVSISFLYGEKLIWPILSSHEMKVIVSFDWICLGSSCKHHFIQIMNQVQGDGGSLRSMMGKGDLYPTFRSAGVRLKLELDSVNTVLRLHVDSLTFIFRVLNSLDGVGNSFLQYKSFHTAEGFYFSLPERTKPFGQHILSISLVFKANPVSIFCFYSGPMPSRQNLFRTLAPITRAKGSGGSELHHGVFRFATKTFVFKLEQSHVRQPASKYDQRMAIMMENDDIPRKLEWVINLLEIETKMLSIYDVGFHHNCNGWYGDGNTLVVPSLVSLHFTQNRTHTIHIDESETEVDEHLNFLEYHCQCSEQCAVDGRPCDDHHIVATSVGVKLTARSEKSDVPRGSGESQRSGRSQRSTSQYEDALEGVFSKKTTGSDVRDRTRLWVGGLAVGETGVKVSASNSSSSPLVVLSELLKKPLNAIIKSEDRYFVPSSFTSLGSSCPKTRVIDARDMMLDILAESLFVQITYENRYAYSVWSNGLRCSLKDEPVKHRNLDVHAQLSESEIKWRRFLDPTDEMIGSNAKTSDARGKLAVPEHWQHCNEYQETINRTIWRLQLKEPQLGIQALPPERQGKNFQCRLQHRLLLTGKTGQILNMAVRFADKKEKCWKAPRSHTSLLMDGIMVRMAADNNVLERNIAVSRRSQDRRHISVASHQMKDAPDENTYILTKLWNDVGWVTGDAVRNAAQQIVLESPHLKFSFFCDLVAPNSVKNSNISVHENLYMHSSTHVDLTYGNVVSVLIQDVKIVTDSVQFRVFSEVINGLLRPLPTEAEADDMMESLRLNALLDSNVMQRIKKIEMDIEQIKRQRNDPLNGKHEEDLREEQTKLEAQLRQLTQAGQEQLSEQRLRFLSYHLLNCTWEIRAKEEEIDSAFEKGVRSGSQGSPDQMTTFSKVQLEDVFGTVSYANTEPQGFSFRVRSFVVNNQTSDHPRLGEYVFLPKEGLAPSPGNTMSEIQADVQNATNIAAAIHKFLGGIDEDSGPLQEKYSHQSGPQQQMLNIEIFKAPRVGGVDVYERLAVDVAAMTVCIPHEFFVLLYDFIFEAEKKAFLQPAFNDLHEDGPTDAGTQLVQVVRFSKNDVDAENEQMLQTKMEIKNRSRDYHFFHKVQVSKLNALVSYKGPNVSWNLRDITDLELSVSKIEFQDQTLTWAEMFEQFKDKIMRALIEQAPKVARHKLSDLFSRKKPAATLPSTTTHAVSFGGSASAPVTPIVGSRGDVLMSRSAGGGGKR